MTSKMMRSVVVSITEAPGSKPRQKELPCPALSSVRQVGIHSQAAERAQLARRRDSTSILMQEALPGAG